MREEIELFSHFMDSFLIFHPILRGPFFTCVALGMLGGLLGVWLFFQKQLLIGEVLSHSIFPGMVIGYIISSFMTISGGRYATQLDFFYILLCGVISAYVSVIFIRFIVNKKYAYQDSALSSTLSSTFGFALLLISLFQNEYPTAYRSLTALFMGQAATIPNHFAVSSWLFFFFIFTLFLIYRRGIYAYLFDAQFSDFHRLISSQIHHSIILCIIITSVLGIRLVGVVLMSAMFTFPPATARYFFDRISTVTLCSIALGGGLSGLGVLVSHQLSTSFSSELGKPLWIPTGPIIVLFMSFCFSLALLFSPRYGLVIRMVRRRYFYWKSHQENILKFFWMSATSHNSIVLSSSYISQNSPVDFSSFFGRLHYWALIRGGYAIQEQSGLRITSKSLDKGEKLVRLHRLWELYLVEKCGMDQNAVHPSAEEMEHILTPEMEKELTMLLNNPITDPHKQPIPPSTNSDIKERISLL